MVQEVAERGPNRVAEQAEDIRDLKGQIAQLSEDPEDEAEMTFKETSPRRRKVLIYSMLDGEEIQIPRSLLTQTMEKKLPDGRPMFTAYKDRAPKFKMGQVKCFLHRDSEERQILTEIGITKLCPAGNLASLHSKRIHAQHRHRQEWEPYQEWLAAQSEQENRDRQDRQLEATLAIARGVTGAPAPETCDQCDYEGTARQVQGHRMGAHKG